MSLTIPYRFSPKHRDYILRCRTGTVNVAEGAVRAGKTIDNLFAFAEALDRTPDRLHLATGSSASTAKLILCDGDGFGLSHIFRGRCRLGRHLDCDCLYITALDGKEKIVLFAGGGRSDSHKKIRGFSIGLWIATEINLHHPDMVKEAFNRQLAARERKIFWDLNPSAPNHFIYTAYLDRYRDQTAAGQLPDGFYNYEHFTIFDNPTVSEERRNEIIAQYEKGSIWYRRDIEGMRCAAEGLIWRRYADSPDAFSFRREDPTPPFGVLQYINIGVDFGGNRSRTAFVATALTLKEKKGGAGDFFGRSITADDKHCRGIAVLLDRAVGGEKGEIDAARMCREFVLFYRELTALYPGVEVRYIFCDSEAQYLIGSLRRACREAGIGATLRDARKSRILSRIACVTTLLATGRLYVSDDCRHLPSGLADATWEEGEERRADNFTSDIDILDAFEYSFEAYMERLV